MSGFDRAARAQLHVTNNWPPESLVDNKPTANVMVWSVLSLIALLGGVGLLFGAFGRWRFLGWQGREQAALSRGQAVLAFGLLGALALVGGSMVGELAGIHGWTSELAEWFGNQGWEYLDLGRFWQILLSIGIFA